MGSSVDEGDDLLNVETGRATTLALRRPVLFLPQAFLIALPIAVGLIRNLCLPLWTSRPVRVTRLTPHRLANGTVVAQRRLFSIKPVLLFGES